LLRSISAFQEIYPDVSFDVQYIPRLDLKASYEAASIDGYAPSILIGPAEWGPDLYDREFVADISGLADSDLINILNPAAVGSAQYRSGLIGLPLHLEGIVLYRNLNIIPSSPATFDDLVSLSQEATRGEIVGAYLDRNLFYSGGHLYGLGGKFMDSEGAPAFNDEHGLAWIELLKSFELAGPTDYFTDNDVQLFKEGRVGFLIESTRNRTALAEAIGEEDLVIDPWPLYGNGVLSGFVTSENVYLSPHALNEPHQVSWRFIEFLLNSDSQSAIADVGHIPAINGSPVILAGSQIDIKDPLIAQAMFALVEGATYPVIPAANAYLNPIDVALQSVFNNGVEPAIALQAAHDEVLMRLDELQATATPSP
jgi:arabinogalactan oligomer/maltooligosaccharide transport system substrate-binding protein